jgi:hypothetical protein
MWPWTPEAAELLAAVALVIGARIIDRRWSHAPLPTPRSPRYDEAAHAERVRAILHRYVNLLPLPALVKLQEVAALLEAGEPLKIALAREKLGKRGRVQVQPRETVEAGERSEAAIMAQNAALEDEERAAVGDAIRSRGSRFLRT